MSSKQGTSSRNRNVPGLGYDDTGVAGSNAATAGVSRLPALLLSFPCGTCGVSNGVEDSFECEHYKSWTHCAQKCSGLPPRVFLRMLWNFLIMAYVSLCLYFLSART